MAARFSGLLLLLAKLCIRLERHCLPSVMEALASSPLLGRTTRQVDQPPALVAGEVARHLGTAANTLLNAYVEAHGRHLSAMVRRRIEVAVQGRNFENVSNFH